MWCVTSLQYGFFPIYSQSNLRKKEIRFGHHKSCILATQPQKAINCQRVNELLEQVMCVLATYYNAGSATVWTSKVVHRTLVKMTSRLSMGHLKLSSIFFFRYQILQKTRHLKLSMGQIKLSTGHLKFFQRTPKVIIYYLQDN